ncbi:MAG: AAA domain-containing protein, partial [Candidatus Parabeggiatoa sp.]|nr:AAA domain-containing protein [Candidatus Parabeggiatoa sp.]
GYQYQLTPKSKVYQWQLWTEILIQGDEPGWFWITKDLDEEQPPCSDFQPDFEETIRIGKGVHAQKMQCSPEQLQRQGSRWRLFLGTEFEAKQINWSGYRLEIEPIQTVPREPQTLRFKGEDIDFDIVNTHPLQLKVRAELHQGDRLQINDNDYAIERVRAFDKKQLPAKVYQSAEGRYWTCNQPKLTLELCEIQDITSEYLSTLTPDKLTGENWDIEGYEAWEAKSNNIRWTLDKCINQTTNPKDERLAELTFDLTITEPDKKWIQLLEETEENDESAESGQSTLEHFFSDNVSILDANSSDPKKAYRILKANYEEKRLLLAKDKSANSVYPPKETHLKVKVELGSLRKQQDAITKLRKTPPPQLKGLIQLVNDRQQVQWPIFPPKPVENWAVLTDLAYDGCDSQRQFVQKALATPDFAILDGPPGTGKTTTILELIIQLVERDQRVLLCGSTHAAINNVLERISEQKLLDKIFPLRIGDENRAIGVEEFQYDNVLKQFQKNGIDSEQLLVDTANLVCGTTMGILRLFREEKVNLDRGIPPFDVLIVDECSKTPFQEFIVPAIYAKRWILVGDVRQLSPFTDRDVIVGNLRELFLPKGKGKGDYLNKNLQKACFYLQALFPYKNQFVITESGGVIKALAQEINARIEAEDKLSTFALILQEKYSDSKEVLWYDSSESNFYRTDLETQAWCLYDYDYIFIEQSLYKTHSHLMPADAIVLDAHWQSNAHAFRHQARWQGQQYLKQRNQELTNSFDIQQNSLNFLQSRDWADELVWRLEREYWLRFLTDRRQRNQKGKKTRIEEQLQRLFPQSEAAEGRIYQIRNIAFPSVLEALSGEGITKHRKDMPTTLNQGFYPVELKCRYTTLTYQH